MKKIYLFIFCAVSLLNNEVNAQCPTATFTSNAPQCIGTAINFTYTGVGTGGTNITYQWDFGAGATPSTSTAQNPTGIVYSTSGNKTITLNVRYTGIGGLGGCANNVTTNTQTITINATPTASFTSTAPQCTGLAVNFTNTGTSAGVTWAWNFGIGAAPANSTAQNPAGVIYSSAGSKIVTLTTTNTTTNCTGAASQTININKTPVASFTSTAPQCVNAAVTFTNTGTSDSTYTYSWDFGPEASPANSTSQNPTAINYATSGIKPITFEIKTTQGCSNSTVKNITINATPIADFTSTAPQCTGLNVDFTNTGTSAGVTWAWSFGSGATPATSVSNNPTGVVYSTSGSKIVSLITTNSTTGCSDTITQTINIKKTPTVSFTSTAPQCVNTAVSFTNTGDSDSTYTYNWDFGAGVSPANSISQNPTGVIYTTSGTKSVTFKIETTEGCSNSTVNNIAIEAKPNASFSSTAPKCTLDTVEFTNTSIDTTTNATYLWSLGSGGIAISAPLSSQNFIKLNNSGVIYSTAGTKIVTLIVTNNNSNSCADTISKTININQTPSINFTTTYANPNKCVNAPVNYTNTGSTGVTLSYNWDFGNDAKPSSSSAENPKGIIYSSSGIKTTTFEIKSVEGCFSSMTQTFTIAATPVANFTSTAPQCTGVPVNFTATGSVSNVNLAWKFGANALPTVSTGTVSTVSGVFYSVAGVKTVTLIVTNPNNCADTSIQTININQTPAASFTTNASQCVGAPVAFTNTGSTGGFIAPGSTGGQWSYSWDFGPNASPRSSSSENPVGITYSSGGNKLVTHTVYNQYCTKTDTQTVVTIYALPIANAGKDTTICANTSVKIGTPKIGNDIYSWFATSTLDNGNIPQPTATPIASNTQYIVTVTNLATNCVNKDTVGVTMLAPLVANAGADVVICRYDSVQLGAALVKGQKYIWSSTAGLSDKTSPNPMASPDSTIIYKLTVTGNYLTTGVSCPAVTDEVMVTVHQLPIVKAGPNDSITKGSSIQLVATGGLQYEWTPPNGLSNPGINTPVASPEITTKYTVHVVDIYGCKNEDSVLVTVLIPAVWVPNAFTPNGDGKDDIFIVRGQGINDFDFGVFNRWGEQIFHSNNMASGWDGTRPVTGENLPPGAYVYYIKGVKTNNEAVNIKGMVNLIR
jgi:gliding motility-associated-like protein